MSNNPTDTRAERLGNALDWPHVNIELEALDLYLKHTDITYDPDRTTVRGLKALSIQEDTRRKALKTQKAPNKAWAKYEKTPWLFSKQMFRLRRVGSHVWKYAGVYLLLTAWIGGIAYSFIIPNLADFKVPAWKVFTLASLHLLMQLSVFYCLVERLKKKDRL